MASVGVVLDACVLFPGSLRDTLLRTADAGLFQLYLTDEILEEMKRNLVSKGHTTEEKARYIVEQIKKYFPEAFITRHSLLVPVMPINEKDRHVLAAAVASGAQMIVTQNLKDFPSTDLEPLEIEALSADDFLVHQFFQEKEIILSILKEQAGDLKRPPQTPLDIVNRLENITPNFAALVREALEVIEDVAQEIY